MSLLVNNKKINIASVILAGGKGKRLYPLTKNHSKPAISYGGRYRLIDIPISNSLNSNIRQMFVIGQYLTAELQHHLSQTYQFDAFHPGMLDFLSPEEFPNGQKIWFDGTADAVRKNLDTILKAPVDYFLILSGDQLYNIDFKKMLEFHIEKDANLTIASLPVESHEAQRLGILKANEKSFIIDFIEKPQEEETLKHFSLPSSFLKEHDLKKRKPQYLASMGIYIFKRQALQDILKEDAREDFGKYLIPTEIKKGKTVSFVYDGYWEDIGTIESYYKANLALTDPTYPGLKTYDENNPIYTRVNHLPGVTITNTKVKNSILCEGSVINAKEITQSVIGLRSFIKKGTIIQNSIVLGNNYYISPSHQEKFFPSRFEIGKNCLIKKTIIDEHTCIGNNVQLINKENLSHYDGEGIIVRDGIIVVTAGAHIPDNFVF